MSGIRLHHDVLASCTYVVETPQPYLVSYRCPRCTTPDKVVWHDRKAIHIDLDAHGDTIVSREVYDKLRTVPTMAGLELVNEIAKPPPLVIGAVDTATQLIVPSTLNQDHKPADFYVPGQTKYQGRDKVQAGFARLLTKADAAKLKRKSNGSK